MSVMKPTAGEVSSLKGTEIIYVFDESNGDILNGKVCKAYVAQSDVDKGITIMGHLPDDGDDVPDCVIQCCNSHGNPDSEDYIEILNKYITLIKSGVFEDNTASGGDVYYMNESCAFS